MNLITKIGLGLAILIILVFGVGMFMPGQAHVERSVVIQAAPDMVFSQINNLRNMNVWSPWSDKDPNAVYSYSDLAEGVGSYYTWTSEVEDVGNGRMEITEIDENKRVAYALSFEGEGDAMADIHLEAADGGTKVTWGFDMELGINPILRLYVGPNMDKWLGPDYEKGVANLKVLVEKQVAEAAAAAEAEAAEMAEEGDMDEGGE